MPSRLSSFPCFALVALACVAVGHDLGEVADVTLDTERATVVGTLMLPHTDDPPTCVLLLGGTLSQGRNGELYEAKAPPRDALQRLAEALAHAGCASFRYDRVGYGASKPKPGWNDSYTQQGEVVAAVVRHLRGDARLGRIVIAGESAGAYVACLAAKDGTQADGYIFLGGLCRSGPEMYAYTFGQFVAYAESTPERLAWANQHFRKELALGRRYADIYKAAQAGGDSFELVEGDFKMRMGGLHRRREELRWPPNEMFRYIRTPTLALAGAADRNVNPQDALRIEAVIRGAGNDNVRSLLIPEADHSFQQVPLDEDTQVRERYSLTSFRRPYQADAYFALLDWLAANFGTAKDYDRNDVAAIAEYVAPPPQTDSPTTAPTTRPARLPEKVDLPPGIELVADVMDPNLVPGVDTLEGRVGPLIYTDNATIHYFEMAPGTFVPEHPHPTGSMIYTARGRWVLCSGGNRRVMPPGSLFWFGPNVSTGYEVPFAESAYILIFNGRTQRESEDAFVKYLTEWSGRLRQRNAKGEPFRLWELPHDHPARVFAREVSPEYAREVDARQVELRKP